MAREANITGCRLCPLEAELVLDWGLQATQSVCQHPDGRDATTGARAVADEDEPAPVEAPDWCPLRTSSLTVQLRAAPPSTALVAGEVKP